MLVVVSDERAVLGELFVTQFAHVRRASAAPMSSRSRRRRRHDLVERGQLSLLGRLGRPPALSRAAPARHRVRRHRVDRLRVDVIGDGGRRQAGDECLERVRGHRGVRRTAGGEVQRLVAVTSRRSRLHLSTQRSRPLITVSYPQTSTNRWVKTTTTTTTSV